MPILIYRFSDGGVVEFELADTPFAKKWLAYFTYIIEKFDFDWIGGSAEWSGDQCNKRHMTLSIPLQEKILANLQFLDQQFNLNFSDSIDKIIHEIQKSKDSSLYRISHPVLNQIHRNFTSLIANNIFNNILISTDDEVDRAIHELNNCVHQLESMSANNVNPLRQVYNNRPVFYSRVTDASNPINSKLLWQGHELQPIKDRFDPLIEHTQYSVWLNEDILGKDLVRCWLDHDNSHHFDITGNLFMTPSLMFDPHFNYHSVLTNKEFIKFYNNTHKTLDRFPIGNIIQIQGISRECKILSISIDNKVVWKRLKKYL